MTSPGDGRHIDLDQGAALHLDDARGTTLRVNRGRLWVTQDRDSRDIVLTAGSTWTIERNGLTIATAQEPSSLAMTGKAAARVDERGRRLSWLHRVMVWLERRAARPRWVPRY